MKHPRFAFGDYNLKRYFGVTEEELRKCGWWLDHYFIENRVLDNIFAGRAGDPKSESEVVLISEPYTVDMDTVEELLRLCQEHALEVYFMGRAEHNSGCLRIEITSEAKEKVLARITGKDK
jgi:hypothetical protein